METGSSSRAARGKRARVGRRARAQPAAEVPQADTADSEAEESTRQRYGVSQLPHPQRVVDFSGRLAEKGNVVIERSLVRPEFASYGIIPAFRRLGWEGILEHSDVYYPGACADFIAGIYARGTDSLTSLYRGQVVTVTLAEVREIALIDTGDDYELRWMSLSRQIPDYWTYACRITELEPTELDGLMATTKRQLLRAWLPPLARTLQKISETNICARKGNPSVVRDREVFVLHALLTGSPRLSLGHIILDSWFETLDNRQKAVIPFITTLSRILRARGLIHRHWTDPVAGTWEGDEEMIATASASQFRRAMLDTVLIDDAQRTMRTRGDRELTVRVEPVTDEERQSELILLHPPGTESDPHVPEGGIPPDPLAIRRIFHLHLRRDPSPPAQPQPQPQPQPPQPQAGRADSAQMMEILGRMEQHMIRIEGRVDQGFAQMGQRISSLEAAVQQLQAQQQSFMPSSVPPQPYPQYQQYPPAGAFPRPYVPYMYPPPGWQPPTASTPQRSQQSTPPRPEQ